MKRTLLILALAIIGFFTNSLTPTKHVEILKEATNSATARVVRVIDGDTIEIVGGQKVRYIGMDTPELQTNACYSREAAAENETLVEGKSVRLVGDVSETDTYGRLLRYVYADNVFVNDVLVREGFARAEPIAPDTLYSKELLAAQDEAKESSRGLWAGCAL
jgi:micrococcal nuclease